MLHQFTNKKNNHMEKLKVLKVDSYSLIFDDGTILESKHDRECCEHHYLWFKDLKLEDFEGLEFDLSNDDFFERIEGYGIALKPITGFPVRVPGYGENNGYYSSDLHLVVSNRNGFYKQYEITECQDY